MLWCYLCPFKLNQYFRKYSSHPKYSVKHFFFLISFPIVNTSIPCGVLCTFIEALCISTVNVCPVPSVNNLIFFCRDIFCCIQTVSVGTVYRAQGFALISLGSASWRWLLTTQHAHVSYSVLCLLVQMGSHSSSRRLKENQSHC